MNYLDVTYKGVEYQVEWESIDFFEAAHPDGDLLEMDAEAYEFFEGKVSEAIADKYNEDNPEGYPDPADQERAWGRHFGSTTKSPLP